MAGSFLFYDLETFGSDPRRTRIAQFAAIRTDEALQEIEAPISVFVKPAQDLLPSPGATMVTHITPQQAQRDGVVEAEAFSLIADELSRPDTCTLGWNSLRFDDEFVRHGLFRNFHDPYEREWRAGNCRWDLLDAMRLARALRPEGIHWPLREDGATSFRLEHLALANDVREGDAHEALSDVRATIGMARRLREAQPRLWEYALKLRDKRFAAGLLDVAAMQPALHISQRYPASRLCASAVVPLARHPRYDGRIIVFDLDGDVDALLELPAADIAARLYTRSADRLPGERRVPLKEVHLNRSPALVAWSHLREDDFGRLGIDRSAAEASADRVRANAAAIAEKVRQVFAGSAAHAPSDPDASLYDGFLADGDRRRLVQVRGTPAAELGTRDFGFQDPRLVELLFRYRARNWPHLLDAAERSRWDDYRRTRFADGSVLGEIDHATYTAEIAVLRAAHAGDPVKLGLLDALDDWARTVMAGLEGTLTDG